MNPETLEILKQAGDELDALTEIFYKEVQQPDDDPTKRWPTFYHLTRMCYVMQSMMKVIHESIKD